MHLRPRLEPIKPPDRCPHCNSPKLTTKGSRKRKLGTIKLYKCKACGRVFTPGPRAIRHKTYSVPEILEALPLFNLGHSLAETAERLAARYGNRIDPATISRWITRHPRLTTYRRLREGAPKLYRPAGLIRTAKLYHKQVYAFGYHRAKLALVRNGTIDDRRSGDRRFAGVADFLEEAASLCPHDLFRRDDGLRGSQLSPAFLPHEGLIIEKRNVATDTAALIIPSVGSNHQRHERLQRFMLVNDSTTIAVEVPIWLTEEDLTAIEDSYGITISPKQHGQPRHLTGHIDFLQVRNGALHILDYKPDARTNRPIAQLTIYALALTRLVPGLRLFDIKCAWFNEDCYNEFFPRTFLPKPRRLSRSLRS
ncbi:PD-(D/E)XK nuclease family protein [Bradyrhizobium guangxiense]